MGARVEGLTIVQLERWLSGDIRDFHIKVAEEDLKAEVRSGFDDRPVVITDGVPLRNYLDVKPFGKIEFARRVGLREPIEFAYEMAVRLSPYGPPEGGHYREQHIILVNGVGLSSDRLDVLDRIKDGDRVQLVNTMPYARKIEGARANRRKGWKGRRGLSRQAPGGVYRKVHQALVQRFGRAIMVDYRLERLDIGGVIARSSSLQTRGKGGYYTYPVLQFFIRPSIWS